MHVDLPAHLTERVLPGAPPPRAGAFVLVWLRLAVRAHENPALDVARHAAQQLGLPLLTYHAVSERYPHASDRHHAFILQGARDLADELDASGLVGAFHVERPGHRGPVLRQLAANAALVVADAVPLDPVRGWTERLALAAPVWRVDSMCVAPMPSTARAPTRAFQFRDDTARARAMVSWPWPDCDAAPEPYAGALPFAPVDLRQADLAALIGACAIDHQVAPIADTPGGSVAGYARWAAFCASGLRQYPRLRNDAAQQGVSRMSAYLHFGHVSPFRIAREAVSRGADKFAEELLVWRELAWHLCYHTREARAIDALPAWARATLAAHADDPRDVLPLAQLDGARTGEPLWDAAQRSLLRHGELHNNVRMTWGKAMLGWSKGPRQALARLFALNDRYALDGRDPASVGGIIWCLGGLDRPFSPELPVYGSVRPRSVSGHAERLDLSAYAAHVDRANVSGRVLVVGAGIAGAAAASTLAQAGVSVVLVDKARGPGGRMSTRRGEHGVFDHAAQSFTVRDPRFERQVRLWQSEGLVTELGDARYVGAPRMAALPASLVAGLDARYGLALTALHAHEQGVTCDRDELGRFDAVIVTAPAPQAAALLTDAAPALAAQLASVDYAPCWAVMASGAAGLPWERQRFDAGPLAWASRQDALPGRDPGERWVLHATAAWSADNFALTPEQAAEQLIAAFVACGARLPDRAVAHRWRYARVERPLHVDYAQQGRVFYAGDGCLGARVEAAWLSGVAAAGAFTRQYALGRPPASRPA